MRARTFATIIISIFIFTFTLVCITQLQVLRGLTTGIYSYDPRDTRPSRLFIKVPPETALGAKIEQQIVDSSGDSASNSKHIVAFEFTHVDVHVQGGGVAYVTGSFQYSDGTGSTETFSLESFTQTGADIPFLPDTKFAIEYGHLGECQKSAPHLSYCRLDF